ncbi:MAG TPA: hypothetical protein IAD43_09880 [Candidatus Scatomorpha pullicola]|nr:hypothetical protein [Candidatus Scatomorpha pullicola]
MKKTLYSLMLSDDVVRAVDELAHSLGTNRSSLINQILADYVSITTPERRINDIFHAVEQMLAPSRELVPFFSPRALTMSLKSSLEYKYRPTVKYEVQLFRSTDGPLGELSVVFRTQSAALIEAMTQFFRLWKHTEDRLLAPLISEELDYALYDGKFVRTIAVPRGRDVTAEEVAEALSDYIKLFDRLMKGWLSGRLDANDVQSEYYADLSRRKLYI